MNIYRLHDRPHDRLHGSAWAIGMLALLSTLSSLSSNAGEAAEGTRVFKFYNYEGSIELKNETTRVVLCPAVGGRVLVYEVNGKNGLYLAEEEKQYRPGGPGRPPASAGRFDIGPEQVIPRRDKLWSGRWEGKVIGDRAARLTSQVDEATGVQLIRDFQLDKATSHLKCTQTIVNRSKKETQWCHWSRTFALGNGICVIPLSKTSKYPNHYVMYHPMSLINTRPVDPNIRRKGDFLEILGVPKYPKLGMDSMEGWFAYLMRNDLMFIKSYQTYPNEVYNEVAGFTISIWYPADRRVELEPIGPRKRLQPGESGSFTEHWRLIPYQFPADPKRVDSDDVARNVRAHLGKE